MAERQEKQKCAVCGVTLNTGNSWVLPERMGGILVPYCSECMEKNFKGIATYLGYKLALFVCCAQFNMPYKPELLEESREYRGKRGTFESYIATLRAHELHDQHGKCLGFGDGVTDITKAFGGEYATLEVDDEMLNDAEYKKGHIGQVKDWGYGPKERPYTQEDYDLLDQFYDALTSDRANVSKQVDVAIRNICILKLEQRYCTYAGDYGEAKKLEDIIKAEMEGEQLRKKDELPQDRVRLDDIALACERAGLLGKSYDDLVEILAKKMFHTPYGYTRDAADQMLLLIRNATAFNEGYAEIDRLPDDFAVQDPLGEFAQEPDDAEKQIYKELQITPLQMKAGD